MKLKKYYFALLCCFPLLVSAAENFEFYLKKHEEGFNRPLTRTRSVCYYDKGALFEDLVLPAISRKITNESYFEWLYKYLESEEGRETFCALGLEFYNDIEVFDLRYKIELLQSCLGLKSLLSRRAKHELYAKLLASLHEELLTPQKYKELDELYSVRSERRKDAARRLRDDREAKNQAPRSKGGGHFARMTVDHFLEMKTLDPVLVDAYKKAEIEAHEPIFLRRRHNILRWDLRRKVYPRFAKLLSNQYYASDPVGVIELFELSKIPEKTHYKDLLEFMKAYCYRYDDRVSPEFRERYAEIMRERQKRNSEKPARETDKPNV